jgi:hypothetical protein
LGAGPPAGSFRGRPGPAGGVVGLPSADRGCSRGAAPSEGRPGAARRSAGPPSPLCPTAGGLESGLRAGAPDGPAAVPAGPCPRHGARPGPRRR